MSLRVCSVPGCPVLCSGGRCPSCAKDADKARGTSTQRGYGTKHINERAKWARIIARTPVSCARCHGPITSADEWQLDHNDDRTGYLGPSHKGCNLSAAGKASHR